MPATNNARFLEVRPGEPAWDQVAAFVAATDPVDDLLLHADVMSALGSLSTVWLLAADGVTRAVAYSFPLHPARPALGVRGLTASDEAACIAQLQGPGYIICDPAQRPLWASRGQATEGHSEAHMVVRAESLVRRAPHPAVRPAAFAEVDAFYRANDAGAWNPAQFETGPYVVAEADGAIVAAAGSHFAYPGLAQVGNVLTTPGQRGRGWAKACTAAVCEALVAQGHETLSLFVATENAAAMRVYAGLGFETRRELAAFAWG